MVALVGERPGIEGTGDRLRRTSAIPRTRSSLFEQSGKTSQRMDMVANFGIRGVWLSLLAPIVLLAGGTGTGAEEPSYPVSIAVDESGAIYLADRDLPGIWRLEGDQLSLYYRASKKSRSPLSAVRCLAFDRDGRLLAGDSSTRDVYRFDENGTPQPLTAQGGPLGQIQIPMDLTVQAEGDLLVSDLANQRIVKVPKEGGAPRKFAAVAAPRGLFFDSQKRLWVISGRRLVRFSAAGEPETIVDDGVFQFPHTVAVGEDGVAYVCDGHAQTIWRIAPGREPEKWVSGEPLDNPVGMRWEQGTLLVVDPRARAVFEIHEDGQLTRRELRSASQ